MDFSNPILIDLPMPIVTPRLVLRNCQPGDGAKAHEAIAQTWNELHQWMPWAIEIETVQKTEQNCREAYARFILREDLRIFGYERKTGDFVIGTGLHRFDWNIRRFEIGYWVAKNKQGQGFATEAANALTRYAFDALQANCVAIDAAIDNHKSLNVIEKLGFEKEGILKQSLTVGNGTLVDRHCYSRTSLDGLPDLDVNWG